MRKPFLLCICLAGLLASSCGRVAGGPPPPPLPEDPRSRHDALVALLSPRPEAADRLHEWNNARLYLRKADFILRVQDSAVSYAGQELRNAELALAAVRSARPVPLVTGTREEGYYSAIDDSVQPFVRYLPSRYKRGTPMPLLIHLHGYNPDFNLVNWQAGIPSSLIDLAEREGFLIVMPFGRSNTDFQGIGEQDVLAVIEEMKRRYDVDDSRLILAGFSMGATGAWSLAARHPHLFAGAVMISGRGDYYFWHQLERNAVPAWKRVLIDDDFAGSRVQNLRTLPIFCAHGVLDNLVPVEEARYITRAVGAVNPGLIYVESPGDHFIWDEILQGRRFRDWLRTCRLAAPGRPTVPQRRPLGIRGAFSSPFAFVLADERETPPDALRFRKAANDWYRYAKAAPRMAWEKTVSSNILQSCNVFLFGEPETSALIRQVLAQSPVQVTPEAFKMGARSFPRTGNGLYLMRPSPWNPEKVAVIQCGIPWGEGVAENHKYDFLPDFIVYTSQFDADGSNTALGAGFFDAQWGMAEY
jgi:predicted esterase